MMKSGSIIKDKPKKNKKNRNLKLIIFLCAFLFLILAIPYYFLVPKEEVFKLEEYMVAEVKETTFYNTVSGSGKIEPKTNFVIKAPTKGEVVKINTEVGELVYNGKVLAELSSGHIKDEMDEVEDDLTVLVSQKNRLLLEHKEELEKNKRDIKVKKERHEVLLNELPMWEELYEMGYISEKEIHDKRKEVEQAELDMKEAVNKKEFLIKNNSLLVKELNKKIDNLEEDKAELESSLKDTRLKSKLGGTLVRLTVELGDEVKQGDIIGEVIDSDSLYVKGSIPDHYAKSVEEGQEVIMTSGGSKYLGEVSYISSVGKMSQVDIEVEFDGPPQNARIGTSLSLEIRTKVLRNRLALPRVGRFYTSGQGMYVYKISDDNKRAKKVRVMYGLLTDDKIEVKSGLEKGDRIISSTYNRYIQYDQIKINPEGEIEMDEKVDN